MVPPGRTVRREEIGMRHGLRHWQASCVRLLAALALSTVALSGGAAAGPARDLGPRAPGAFDYYVLALSWEPGFCATTSGHTAECRAPKGFVLHGLWPQLEGGSYPSNCQGPPLSADQERQWGPLYADPSLIEHEWPKHGTCSGLAPQAYFQLSARDVAAVTIPEAYRANAILRKNDIPSVISAFLAANPGMTPAGIRVNSRNGIVTEADICLTKTGAFRAC
jgi:ribonuclease T2